MASDTDDIDITEFTEKNEETKPSGVDKKKEMDILLIQIKMSKTYRKNESYETATRTGKTLRKGIRSNRHRKCD